MCAYICMYMYMTTKWNETILNTLGTLYQRHLRGTCGELKIMTATKYFVENTMLKCWNIVLLIVLNCERKGWANPYQNSVDVASLKTYSEMSEMPSTLNWWQKCHQCPTTWAWLHYPELPSLLLTTLT